MTRRRDRPSSPARRAHATPPGAWLREMAAMAQDPARVDQLGDDDLLLIVFQQCLYFAHTQDPSANAALADVYPRLAARVGEDDRVELLERVTESVESGGSSVVALLPFLQHETSVDVVALAAGAFATLMPLTAGDELTGPRTLARMAEHAEDPAAQAGIAAGLLELGDARVRPLLDALWRALPAESRARLAARRPPSPLVFAATVDFWADALTDAGPADAAAIGAALEALARAADPPRVLDVRRKFPANAADDRDEIEILADRPLAEVAERIAPRLRAAAAVANDGLAGALAVWGIRGA